MVNRGSRTGELTQLVGVMFTSVDECLLSTRDSSANTVGTRELLGVAVPGRKGHQVEPLGQLAAGRPPIEDDASVIGENDADRFVLQLLMQRVEDWRCAAE